MDPNLPTDQQDIDDTCVHGVAHLKLNDKGVWVCTKCLEEETDAADFTGASDELGFANDR